MSPELRECPFCGAEATHGVNLSLREPKGSEIISCSSCLASMRKAPHDQSDLVAAWNQRTADPLLVELAKMVMESATLFESVGIECSKEWDLLKRVSEELH